MGDERWQVTGSAAEIYERELVPAIFGPWAARVLDLAAPAAGERVLAPGGRLAASVRAFLLAQAAGSPLAGPIGAAGPDARAGLLAEMEAALAPWHGADGLAFPIEALLVGGRR